MKRNRESERGEETARSVRGKVEIKKDEKNGGVLVASNKQKEGEEKREVYSSMKAFFCSSLFTRHTLPLITEIEDLSNLRLVSSFFQKKVSPYFFEKFFVSISNVEVYRSYELKALSKLRHLIKKVSLFKGAGLEWDFSETHGKLLLEEEEKEEEKMGALFRDVFPNLKECIVECSGVVPRCQLIFGPEFPIFSLFEDSFSFPNSVETIQIACRAENANACADNVMSKLPPGLKKLYIEEGVSGDDLVQKLPSFLQVFYAKFDQWVEEVDHLPNSLHKAILRGFFNANVDHLPKALAKLELGADFNQPIDYLPSSLRRLCIGSYEKISVEGAAGYTDLESTVFNQAIDHLPLSLCTLYVGTSFNKNVDHLPLTLTTLIFGDEFDQAVDNLPPSLFRLVFGESFNRCVNHLPEKLSSLIFRRGDFDRPVDHLPPFLQCLLFAGENFNQSLDHLPSSLLCLYVGVHGVKRFNRFNQPVDHLPSSLIQLSLGGELFKQPIDHLPSSLKDLVLGAEFNQRIDHLPPSLSTLVLGENFNQPLDHLPQQLDYLVFVADSVFDKPMRCLPSSLKDLTWEADDPYCYMNSDAWNYV